ncbi:MAG TPA: N-acetylmuramidase family protein, partial [Noviherbaspirillum sp.]|nr:N-acetylmuramidase family protein [Noviherbaspirillum sp.]
RKEAVCGLEALFLDADRNPIKGLEYILEYCGRSIKGITSEDGKAKKILTDTPTDQVRILVKRFDGTLKEITTVMSGYWNKLVTLVSPLLVIDAELKPHPKQAEHLSKNERIKPAHGPHNPVTPTTEKKELGLKTKQTPTADGKSVTVVKGDIPALDDFLDTYANCELTQADIEAAAKELGCDEGLIYAIAKQESLSSSFFKLGNRTVPKILYERHQFRNKTRPSKTAASPYEKKYPDICGPAYTRAKKNTKGEWIHYKSGAVLTEHDVYGPGGIHQYKRLSKAYQLDWSAALQSCSWGKFQIMGFNYEAAGFRDVISFTKAMSRSETEHIKAFLKFAKSRPVLFNGLRDKNFERIAEGHNGENWRAINPEYASNIEKYYKEYKSKKI